MEEVPSLVAHQLKGVNAKEHHKAECKCVAGKKKERKEKRKKKVSTKPMRPKFFVKKAEIAQLGERQTEDLKVSGSIPDFGT